MTSKRRGRFQKKTTAARSLFEFEPTEGVCFYCLQPLEATLRGDKVRHIETKEPYGQCPLAISARSKI